MCAGFELSGGSFCKGSCVYQGLLGELVNLPVSLGEHVIHTDETLGSFAYGLFIQGLDVGHGYYCVKLNNYRGGGLRIVALRSMRSGRCEIMNAGTDQQGSILSWQGSSESCHAYQNFTAYGYSRFCILMLPAIME